MAVIFFEYVYYFYIRHEGVTVSNVHGLRIVIESLYRKKIYVLHTQYERCENIVFLYFRNVIVDESCLFDKMSQNFLTEQRQKTFEVLNQIKINMIYEWDSINLNYKKSYFHLYKCQLN